MWILINKMAYKIKQSQWKKTISPKDRFHPSKNVYVSDAYMTKDKSKNIIISKYTGKDKPYWTSLMNLNNSKIIKDKKTKTRSEALKVAEEFK